MVLQMARADDVTGQVTISSTCGLSFTSGSPINFGTLDRDATATEQILVISNTGSATADLDVKGTDWTSGDTVTHSLVGNTRYAVGSTADPDPTGDVAYGSKTGLTTSDVALGTSRPGNDNTTAWGFQAVLTNLPFSGALTQTITFTASC